MSVNHFLPHTHSTSSPFSSPNLLVDTTKCFGDELRVCYFNANSLLGHIETMRLFLASRPYCNIIAITDTKLTAQQEDHLVSLGNYVLIRKDRNRQGGAVALFIHKSLTSKFLCASTEERTCQPGTAEYILCEVKSKGIPPLFAAVVYRPPQAPFIEKRNFIGDLTINMQNYSTKVIMVDFNANQLSDSFDAVYIRNLLYENSLKLVPHGATYHRDAGSLLDLCIIDQQDTILEYWKSDTPFIDNYSIITATIDISVPKLNTKPFSFLDFNAVDKNALNYYLHNCDWSVSSDSPDSRLSVLFWQSHICH